MPTSHRICGCGRFRYNSKFVATKPRKRASAKRGPRGLEGRRGVPGIEPQEIHTIIGDIEKIQSEAALQFKRIAQIQVQIDTTLRALKDLGDRAGRQRKRAPR
jgi:hypothetical protein